MKKIARIVSFSIVLILPILVFFSTHVHAWPIPDTGQLKCYNNTGEITCPQPGEAFYGQDGNYTINPPSYTKLDASGNALPDAATSWAMIRDNVTGLIWENKTNDGSIHDGSKTFTWCDKNSATNGGNQGTCGTGTGDAATDTEAFIKALNDAKFGGFSDWRMPAAKELATIIDRSRVEPAANNAWFPNTLSSYYWSSTTYASSSDYAWCVLFDLGGVDAFPKTGAYAVRAVRGGQTESLDHLVINGDGTVTDAKTGLMWQQETINSKTWQAALDYVEALALAGYDDWRLPNSAELQSIVDYGRSYPSIDTTAFPGTVSSYYWSSTTLAYATDQGGLVSFWYGRVVGSPKTAEPYSVRAVRGGQSRLSGHLVISTPAQAARWYTGSQQTITWDTVDIPGNVKITLSRQGGKSGTFTETIADNIPNNGSYTWTVTGPVSVNCVLQIEPLTDTAKGKTQGLFSINNPVFTEIQAIPTHGATDWESFTIDGDAYLAVANYYDQNGSTYNTDSKIYKWNGASFVEIQSIPTSGACDWESFIINDERYLAVANHRSDATINVDSKVYKWTGTSFVEVQAIPTNAAYGWESFDIGNDTYLAVANAWNGSTGDINSRIYRWNGTSFVEVQAVPTNLAHNWESFTINGETYLAVSNEFSASKVYKWNGASFVELQTIPTNYATDWESFSIDGDVYLAIASQYTNSFNSLSKIYKWNDASFVEIQAIPTTGAYGWESFNIGNDTFIAVANGYDGSTGNVDSKIYKWNGAAFVEIQAIPTNGASDWESFTIDGEVYLAVANQYNGSTHNIDSKIYKWSALTAATYTLTVTKSGSGSGTLISNPTGINCGSTCASNYASATSVTLTATQDTGSTFSGWSGGGCSGTGTCTVTMDALKTVTATFDTIGPTVAGMVLIPAGSFQMGDNFSEGGTDERPVHTVAVSAFYLDKYEVTKVLWDDVYAWAITHGYAFDNAGAGTAANHPVQTVSWYDVVKWLNARSEKEGRTPVYYTDQLQTTPYRTGQIDVTNSAVKWTANGYRLPTEAEWEKACRGGLTGNHYPWPSGGGVYTDWISASMANYSSSGTKPVGYYNGQQTPQGGDMANGYGLYDMAGNVLEWTWDWYGSYSSTAATDPRGTTSDSYRVLRGGNWDNSAVVLRSARRDKSAPSSRSDRMGFRSALSQVTSVVTLTVTKAGTGGGTVTSDSGAITWTVNIGTAAYDSGTSVTLIATADSGSTFTGWSSSCTGTGNCTVTMDAAKSVTATFNDTTPPTSPVFGTVTTPTNNQKPTWTWAAGGGGNGTYRYKLDSGDLTNGATETTATSFTPATNLSEGLHTLYVQERDAAGNWSNSQSFTVVVDTTAPSGGGFRVLPKTGQTKCYDAAGTEIACAGTGQDGELLKGTAWSSPRFTDNNNGTITDNLTGLIWLKNANCSGAKNWNDAITTASGLKNGDCGLSDGSIAGNWRLPNVLELESLIDLSRSNPPLPSGHPFTDVQSNYYWSSSTNAYGGFAWVVGMGIDAYLSPGSAVKSISLYVWPVRNGPGDGMIQLYKTGQTISYATGDDGELEKGAAWPSPRFTDNGTGTATDNLTGLIWLKNANCFGKKTWNDAITAVNGIKNGDCGLSDGSTAGDWRLPNRKELFSLIDFSKTNPALPGGHPFTNVQSYDYWSSSTSVGSTGYAWDVGVDGGASGYMEKSSSYYFWPVRGGQSGAFGNLGISINSGATATNSTSVTLSLSATDANGVAQMMVSNDANFGGATEENYSTSRVWTLSSGDGEKTVYVKFKDAAGNWSQVYSDTITLDTATPVTTISSKPSSTTNSTSASFSFASEAGSTFQCQLDGGSWGACTSPVNYSSLAPGTHTFGIKATDAAQNIEATPVTYTWTVDTTAPNAPVVSETTPTNNQKPTWTWASGGGGGNGTFRYKLDSSDLTTGATETTATSYTPTTNLTEGSHTLYIQERDAAGNWSSSGSKAIVVDITPPSAGGAGGSARLPDTGQTKCYNNSSEIACPSEGQAFFGQDGNYLINPPSYTKLDASGSALADTATSWAMIKDNVTGVIWDNKTNDGSIHDGTKTFTWCDKNPATNGGNQGTCGSGTGSAATDTEAFINALNDAKFGGFSDWRMPVPREMVTIIDRSSYNPAINSNFFPNTADSTASPPYWSSTTYVNSTAYWSSTTYVNPSDGAWCVNLAGQVVYANCSKSWSLATRAVRGGQSSGRYIINGDGTVTDTATGLMWQQEGASGKTWEAALSYAEGLDLAGYSDWRLPNINELESIVDYSRYNPSIDTQAFPGTVSSYYWSSTTTAISNDASAWCVHFNFGGTPGRNKPDNYAVRAVRGGQSGPSGNIGFSINSGAIATKSSTVTIGLSASDANGVTGMMLSNDSSFTGTSEEAYATSKAWTLSSGDGEKTVYVKFKDAAGNWSQVYSDTIALDTTSPTVLANPAGGSYPSAQSVTLSCNDGAGSGCGNIYFTTDNSTPTANSTRYNNTPINIFANTTLKFYAVDALGNPGTIQTETYTIQSIAMSAGNISVVKGETRQTTLTLTSVGGFTTSMNLSHAWQGSAPVGAAVTINPGSVTPTSSGASASVAVTADSSTATGTYTLKVTATGGNITTSKDIQVSVANPLSLGTDAAISGIKGQALTPITTSGGIGTPNFTYTGTLPPGVTFNANGTFSGITTTRGTYTFTATVSDIDGHTLSRDYTVRIYDPLFRQLVLEADSWSVEKGVISDSIFAKVIDDYGADANVSQNTLFNLSSTSATGRFSLDGMLFSLSNSFSPAINQGFNIVEFWYMDTTAGSHTIRATGKVGSVSQNWALGSHGIDVSCTTRAVVTKTGTGSGTVTPDTGTITWENNTGTVTYCANAVTLTASGNAGSIFAGWSGCDSVNGNQCTLNAPKTVTATFASKKAAALTVSATSNAQYGQAVTVSGTLKDAKTGAALPYRTISVVFTAPSGAQTPERTAQTLSDGTYSFLADPTVIDAAGNWMAKVTFKEGSQAEYSDAVVQTNFIINKAYSRLTMVMNTGSISPTGVVTITGQLTANTVMAVDLTGTKVLIEFINPSGTLVYTGETVVTDKAGHFSYTYDNQFESLGLWTIKVRLAGHGNLYDSASEPKDLLVASSAGYAILIQGRDSAGTYADTYTASLDDIYKKLLYKQFKAENIRYLGYPNLTRNSSITYVPTSEQSVQDAIMNWAAERISADGIAPLYIVLVDHGSKGLFHIYPDTITPDELNEWVTALENRVQTTLGKKLTTIIINGTCYSGSFIPKLSKQNRVIITSGAEDEETVQGPALIKTYGEFFVYYLFNSLTRGENLREAFKTAAKATHQYRECKGSACGTNSLSGKGNTKQHPLLDDNGDGRGSWMDVVGQEDGSATAKLLLGLGMNPVGLSFSEVMPTQTFMQGTSPMVAYARTTDYAGTAASWVEVKKPSYVPPDVGGTGQVIMNFPRVMGAPDPTTERWSYDLGSLLTEAGRYTLYYYAMDSNGDIIPPVMATLYVNTAANKAPASFSLTSPTDNREIDNAWMVFQWEKATDPDNDPVTYTLKIFDDETGNEIKRYELIPDEIYSINGAHEKRSDGSPLFVTGKTYRWQVEAIDDKGAFTASAVYKFKITFTNVFNGFIIGKITPAVSGANVRTNSGGLAISLPNGYFFMPHIAGTFDFTVTAGGYVDYKATVTVGELALASVDVALTSISIPPVAPTLSALSSPTRVSPQTIQGTKEANTSVLLNGTVIVSRNQQTNWSYNLPLSEGSNAISLTSKNEAGLESAATTGTIVLDTMAPVTTANPGEGTYGSSQNVTLSANEQATIYYTTDGSNPTGSANVYGAPIAISTTSSLKYFAKDVAGNMEAVKSQTYTIDKAGPSGSIAISGGLTKTRGTGITLNLFATDAAGVAQMQFSNDGTNWSGAESYATTKSWILLAGEGLKTVYVKFKDAIGNWSDPYTVEITLDTTALVTTANPPEGIYGSAQNVALKTDEQATIYYTTDGSNPTESSPAYSVPILVSVTTTLKYFAKDVAGNIEAVKSQTYTIDKIGPSGAIAISGGLTRTNSRDITLNVSATDVAGVTQMQFSNDSQSWSSPEAYAVMKSSWTLSTGDGVKTIYVKFKDGFGNWSNPYNVTITLDTLAPVTTASPGEGTYGSTQNVTLSASEQATIYYTTDGTTPTEASSVYSATIPITTTAILKYFAKDLAGNMENVRSQTYTIDKTGPSAIIAVAGGLTKTNKTGVTLNLSATDGAGVTQMQFSNDGTNWSEAESYATTKSWTLPSGDGTKTIYVKFRDGVGNWSSVYTATVTVETTAPVTTASPAGGNYGSAQTVTLNANEPATIFYTTDGMLPTDKSTIYSGSIVISTTTTLQYFARDIAGNMETVKSQTYTIDKTGPSGSIVVSAGLSRTNNTGITLNLSATDAAGVSQMQFSHDGANWSEAETYATAKSWTLPSGEGLKTIYVRFKDGVGNWSNPYNMTITLDTAAPFTMASPAGGTYGSAQNVALIANEPATIYYTMDGSDPTESSVAYSVPILVETDTTLKYFAKDVAGNSEVVKSQTYAIDKTGPSGSVAIEGGLTKTNKTGITLNLSATHATGVTHMQFSNDGMDWSDPEDFAVTKVWTIPEGEGTKTIYVKFKDGAGNWSNAYTVTITLDTIPPHTTANPGGGTYGSGQNVTLSVNEEATIYYTTDDTNPTEASAVYSTPILIATATMNLKFFAKDVAGNTEAVKTQTYVIEATGPSGSIEINGGIARTNRTGVMLNLSATDASGVTEMQFSNDGTAWTDPGMYATTKAWTLPEGDGLKTVYVRFKDGVGNWSNGYAASVTLDTASPVTAASPAEGTYDSDQSITLSANEPATIYYTTDGSHPTEASTVYSTPIQITGITVLKFFARDLAGNVEPVKSQTYIIDTVGPTGRIWIGDGILHKKNSEITLELTANDTNGVTHMMFSEDGIIWTEPEDYGAMKSWTLSEGDGTKTIYVRFKDGPANWSNPYTVTVTLDTRPPVTKASPTGGTYGSPQNVTLTANESATIYYTTDGSDPTEMSNIYSGSISISATTTLKYFARDLAENVESVKSQTYTIGHSGIPGDLNADGEIMLADLIIALQAMSGMNAPSLRSDFRSSGADVNNNGILDAGDAIYIIQKAAGIR